MSSKVETYTFSQARTLLLSQHSRALERIHTLLLEHPGTTNNDWKALRDARQAEIAAGMSLTLLAQVMDDVERIDTEIRAKADTGC